ncbi:MAG: hypothetical protein HQM16_10690 [Deltaproteobacteria bacterium]|nr:hypothetical protein [Deltaproteobacteria bacterium]
MNANQLKTELNQFTGTEEYHRMNGLLLTDGARYLAERAGAFWLMDVIWSYVATSKKIREEGFLSCKLSVKDNKARFVIDDGNDNVLATQEIEYTDFPLDEIGLFAQRYGKDYVVMLTSEY